MMQEIFKNQKEFQRMIGAPTEFVSDSDRIKAVSVHLRRATDELHEALNELPYDITGLTKHRRSVKFDTTDTVAEIADAYLFIVNALNILNVSPDDFFAACYAKQMVNSKRFETKRRFVNRERNMLIVIEGPDGVGKSHICNELSSMLGMQTLRMPDIDLKGKDVESYSKFYRKVIASVDGCYILDRFFPSSMVYGDYFKRDVDLSDLGKQLSADRDIFVFVIDSDKPFRSDLFINETQWTDIRNLYLQYANSYKWNIIRNDSSATQCALQIIESLQF